MGFLAVRATMILFQIVSEQECVVLSRLHSYGLISINGVFLVVRSLDLNIIIGSLDQIRFLEGGGSCR